MRSWYGKIKQKHIIACFCLPRIHGGLGVTLLRCTVKNKPHRLQTKKSSMHKKINGHMSEV
jgi:hypothetical protein